MEVLLKIGGYAGQLRDVKPLYARGLIERGEATDPRLPEENGGEVVSAAVPPDETVATLTGKRGRKP